MENQPKYPVYLPIADVLSLKFHLRDSHPGVDPEDFVIELVQRWLAINAERETLRNEGPAMHGFQWKNLFLPEGTNLRTSYQDSKEFAKVIGDHIVSDDGEPLTPSQFANRHAKGRNAWRFVWLRFPGEAHWIRALDCRSSLAEKPSY